MAKEFNFNFGRRAFNAAASAGLRFGIGPKRTYLLTVLGRTSGEPRTNPVAVTKHEGERYLVAPYGITDWVKNVRAAGRVTLTRGSNKEEAVIEEVSAREAAPVLKKYFDKEAITRPYFGLEKDASVEDFERVAPDHPVFWIQPSVD